MAYIARGAGAPLAEPCRYGTSNLWFRGPARPVEGRYIVALGGTETNGKFLLDPYPDRLERMVGAPVINLGLANAGVDVFLNDSGLSPVLQGAAATVVQIVGAQNLSNRFYAVHPRRNDRFVAARPALRALYPEVDFTEFSFTRHLLQGLWRGADPRFDAVVAELQLQWVDRMARLLAMLPRPVLLWFCDIAPPRPGAAPGLGRAPLFIDRAMIDALRPQAAAYVELPQGGAGGGDALPDMLGLPGPEAHHLVAAHLADVLRA